MRWLVNTCGLRWNRLLLAAVVVFTAVELLLLMAWGGLFEPRRQVLIHADDAGLCAAVNEATIRGLEEGLVSSTSIMVPCPGFEEFARYAVAHPERDFGVHLVLTAENRSIRWGPVLKEGVASLMQPDGSFWHKSEQVAEHARADEAEQELRAQVQQALDRGIRTSHLDHHMWVLLQRPDLLEVYVRLGEEFRLPIRLHRTFTPSECGAALQDRAIYERLIQPAVARGTPLMDFIDSNNYHVRPNRKLSHYVNALRSLPPGLSEIVIHCSVNRPGLPLPGAADRRAADTAVFTSKEIRDEIRRLGLQVVGWKDLRPASVPAKRGT